MFWVSYSTVHLFGLTHPLSCNIKKLQLVQNFAARIITGTRKFEHITPVLKDLKWLPVEDQLVYRDILMIFKCLKGMASTFPDQFSQHNSIHKYVTRGRNELNIPSFSTSSGQRSFKHRSVNMCNSLDRNLKSIGNFSSFKKHLKLYLLFNFLS